ncbi:ABC-type nitrate/sulfonate/bicarbonate transport system ATPase subunit [Pseudogracilibacillus auburnensis]|uniref:ABC-type nitrate/sulfonate/bicarbonate transport system ATPase subunit n=2 Tax=Pseudogracilibacillus auburnensis TaxID=1494959 RepID=A0A2V3WB18_9BACI|nr:ABC-type nitrate/sulfonate/bicarbonate transport system ATPase subunit [Pseudogracilibacillus auburnensis]
MDLTLENISKSFGEKEILRNISLSINSGEFVSLLGPSGSGKSTLFSLIGGLLKPDVGDIFLNGKKITNKTGYISYMPQQPSLFPWRTVLENAILGQELSRKRDEEKAKMLLEKAGLREFIHAYPHQLSGGMKQRVAFIRALLSPQSMMCLDEPFSALDAFTRLDMQKWLLETWEAYEQSIFFITHDIEEALFLSDKIVVLSSRPAQIKEIIQVPFERPRNESLLLTYPFLEAKKQLAKILDHTNL